MKLLKPLDIERLPEPGKIHRLYGIYPSAAAEKLKKDLSSEHFHVVLHPKSKGSAREWPVENYLELVKMLPKERFRFYVTGTREEGEKMHEECPELFNHAQDMTGRFSLSEFIDFTASVDAMVACSTGPLHLAAALGKHVVGIYPPLRPIHPVRWAPLGANAVYVVENKPDCKLCKKAGDCACIRMIGPEQIKNYLENFYFTIKNTPKKHLQTE